MGLAGKASFMQNDKQQFKFVSQAVVAEEGKYKEDPRFRMGFQDSKKNQKGGGVSLIQNPQEQNTLQYLFMSTLLQPKTFINI
jgi:hypothetical protein